MVSLDYNVVEVTNFTFDNISKNFANRQVRVIKLGRPTLTLMHLKLKCCRKGEIV